MASSPPKRRRRRGESNNLLLQGLSGIGMVAVTSLALAVLMFVLAVLVSAVFS